MSSQHPGMENFSWRQEEIRTRVKTNVAITLISASDIGTAGGWYAKLFTGTPWSNK